MFFWIDSRTAKRGIRISSKGGGGGGGIAAATEILGLTFKTINQIFNTWPLCFFALATVNHFAPFQASRGAKRKR